MLDLPELLEKVFQHLGRHDLTQCAQVNKQWHTLTIPHIWRDLTCVYSGDARRKAFRRMVLEDYLQEKGYQEGSSQPSTLSKCGHLIRLLPSPEDLSTALQTKACTQQGDEPTTHDLLFHLFKHSSRAQVQSLRYEYKDLEKDKMVSVLEFTLPRLRSLVIRAQLRGTQSEFIKFKSVLDQCSTTLESLEVNISVQRADEAVDMEDMATENESICWTSLKNLTLQHDLDTWDTRPFCSWIWKRCSRVERLYVRKINQSTTSLVQAMLAYMHNLHEITMGFYTLFDRDRTVENEMNEDVVAALLSGSHHGWRSVSLATTAIFGRVTMSALAMHYSTLEELHVDGSKDLPTWYLVQVLSSCPHLHTLSYTNMGEGCSVVDGMAFVDLDPDTGLLKPWLCEGSLMILEVKIAGIPRTDLENESVVAEAYPGQGREIQSQVYDRLGRLTKLEMLQLGDQFHFGNIHQYGCLEMSLESGLDKLSGLKSLKELNIEKMETKIGTQEAQWMVGNWPKLNTISGLDGCGRDVEAVNWIRENCPKIVV
ncbi:MAG: hypothetical protein J3Q66DRAFT_390966 [Benniella sp.]|nr:MAG: hypothetical protein J3Q66DRAFT_390966 [Benniella sp.]